MSTPLIKAVGLSEDNSLAALVDSNPENVDHDFRAIFDRLAPLVWRALRHLGVRESDIADQCQEVFLVVFRRQDSFEGRSTLDTWIYGICLRIASEYRRRAHFRREVVQSEINLGEVEPSQMADIERHRARERVQILLTQLDDPQREVFVLYEIEGVDMKSIASLMHCPVQTAYSRLRLARTAIATAYRAMLDQEQG